MTPQSDTSASEATEALGQPDELAKWIGDELKDAKKHCGDWKKEARQCYDYYASKQWSDADMAILNEKGRPPVVFNRTARTVNAICGLEIQNRQEVKYLPREINDSGVNELLTEAAKWVRQNCDAEDEESESFQDLLISGMGWTETRLDYDENKDGQILIERMDPLEMFWDPAARKKNLSDARWIARVKKLSKKEILELFPDYESGESSEELLEETDEPHDASPPFYQGNDKGRQTRKDRELVHFQYFEREKFYRVLTPDGNIVELSAEKFEAVRETLQADQYVEQKKKVYYCAYLCGGVVLEKRPLEVQSGFTFKAMTAARDRNANTWFGLVSLMRDPQQWANKWLSQTMHILNTNAKGGLLAETDAFQNPRKAEDEWSNPDAITWMNPGGLGKVKEKTMAQFPVGIDRLLQYAIDAISDVPGVNAELLGLAGREQPGMLEGMRKQAGITMLALFFDAMRRYRKEEGRILAEMIREYIADGRLVRIVGDVRGQYVPLLKDKITFEYDIVVDEAPTSPNMKERVYGALTQILPVAMKTGIPVPPDILDYTPLPESLTSKWKEHIQQASQKPNQEMERMKVEMQFKQMELEQKAQADQAKMQLEAQKAQQDMSIAQFKAEQEVVLKKEKMFAELQMQQQKGIAEIELQREAEAMKVQQGAKDTKEITGEMMNGFAQLAELMSAPRDVVRDSTGRITRTVPARH